MLKYRNSIVCYLNFSVFQISTMNLAEENIREMHVLELCRHLRISRTEQLRTPKVLDPLRLLVQCFRFSKWIPNQTNWVFVHLQVLKPEMFQNGRNLITKDKKSVKYFFPIPLHDKSNRHININDPHWTNQYNSRSLNYRIVYFLPLVRSNYFNN